LLFHLEVQDPIPDQAISIGTPQTTIDLSTHIFNEAGGPFVRLSYGTLGNIDIQLLQRQAPLSVANFLNYVNAGTFNNTVIHRSEPGFIIQGGGFTPSGTDITPPGTPTVQNEFSAQRSNVRGTVAYAKLGGDPNSATSEFFFNLSDTNASNLDNQNGGFTVFARVIGTGMSVADAIAALARVNATPINSAFNHMPVTRTTNPTLIPLDPATDQPEQTPQTDQMVILSGASLVAPEETYVASSSNPSLVTAAVENNSLSLIYAPGQVGTSTITVTATDFAGATTQDVFTVTVGALEVNIGQGSLAQVIQFTDAEGTQATLTVKGGAALARFSGTGLTQSATGRTVVVNGNGIDIANLVLTGTAPSATLKTVGGDGRIIFDSISAAGPVRAVTGSGILLRGPATFSNGIGKLSIGRADGATIAIDQSDQARPGAASITIPEANGTTIDSQQGLGVVRIGAWTNGAANSITAPAIANLQITGDYNGGLTASGSGLAAGRPALGSARVTGSLTGGTWEVGKTSRVQVGATGGNWIGNFGDVANFTSAGDLSGEMTAGSINALHAASVTGATITLNRAAAARAMGLGRLNSTGAITNSVIRATANIGTVSAGSINGSSIYAGVVGSDGGILPSSATEFSAASSIRGVTVRGPATSPGFINSDIAASALGRMVLGLVQVANAGVPFGLAADAIASLSGIGANGAPIRAARLTNPSQSITQTAFLVRVF